MSDQEARTSKEEDASKARGAALKRSPDDGDGQGVASQARDLAANIAGQTSQAVKERVSQKAVRSASDFADLAEALRLTAKQLSSNMTAPLLNKTADRLEGFSKLLEQPDLREVEHKVERYARERPWMFLGGAVVAGLAGGRLLSGTLGLRGAESTRAQQSNPAKESVKHG